MHSNTYRKLLSRDSIRSEGLNQHTGHTTGFAVHVNAIKGEPSRSFAHIEQVALLGFRSEQLCERSGMNEDLEAQEDELLALDSIFGPEVFLRAADGTRAAAAGELRVSVELPQDFFVAVKDGKQTHLSFIPFFTTIDCII